MRKIMLMLAFFGLLGMQVYAQKTVTGTVTSAADGAALPGVTVIVKGTAIGTVTDIDGKYSISVPSDGTALVFSFVGTVTQEVTISGNTADCSLESADIQIDEFVVTAMGISREQKSLGYSVQEVSGDALNTVKSDNVINAFSGKVSGVQVKTSGNMGGSSNIVIRGSSSITGNNQALFVVDGVPIDNSNTNNDGQMTGRNGYDYGSAASDINANDIESVSILKGAAATALYGARAANGVILITTKKGATGQNLGVTFSSNFTVGLIDKSTFPEYQDQYGPGYGTGAEYSDGDHPYLIEDADFDGDGILDYYVSSGDDASMGEKFDPNLMVYTYSSFIPESKNYMKKVPYQAALNGPITFFNNAYTYSNSIDISGGGDATAFRFSYTNFYQTGIMPNSNLKKNNFTLNGSYDITDNIKVTASANYVNTQGKGRNQTGYSDNIMSSFRQWCQTSVDYLEQKELFELTDRNTTWNANWYDDPTPAYWDSPYWVRYKNYQTDSRDRLIAFTQADWTITDFFSIMGRASVDTYNSLEEERKAIGSIGGEFGVGRPDIGSGYSRNDIFYMETNFDLMGTFNHNITDNITFAAVVGTNIRRNLYTTVFTSTNGGLAVPDIYALNNSALPLNLPETYASSMGVNGIYGSLSFGFYDLFYLDATMRRDQSSTLPEDANSYIYPSVSTSFLFSNLFDASWLQLGKFRVNYATVGSDAPFARLSTNYIIQDPFNGIGMVSVPSTKNNIELKPENTTSIEGGLELKMFNNRVGFDLAVYTMETTNQIIPVSVSFGTGYSSMFENAGTVENKGIETSLTLTPVLTNNFSWDITGNWSKNVNKVVELKEGLDNLQIASLQGGITINARVGEPYGTIQGTDFVYLDGKKVVDENGYYLQTETSDVVIGNVNPDWVAGIQNSFTYKNISFGFLIDFQQGGSVFSLDQYYGMGTGIYPETVGDNDLGNPMRDPIVMNEDGTYAAESGGVIFEGVYEDGTPNTSRVDANEYDIFGTTNPNSAFIFDASYIKLREASFSYTLPSKMLGRNISGLTLSVVGSNLWIIKKNLPYADPEASQGGGNIQGWQSGVLPTTRNIGFSLNLQF